jgi:hypothetical protein
MKMKNAMHVENSVRFAHRRFSHYDKLHLYACARAPADVAKVQ